MKPRHAAALALVGWYLIGPPAASDGRYVDVHAPLSRWRTHRAFDTARECEGVLDELKKMPEAKGSELMAYRCIASDDPRLKEK